MGRNLRIEQKRLGKWNVGKKPKGNRSGLRVVQEVKIDVENWSRVGRIFQMARARNVKKQPLRVEHM